MCTKSENQKDNSIKKLSNQIIYTTVRIETFANGSLTGGGTGFIYGFFSDKDKNGAVFFVVTNKHVVKNAEVCKFSLSSEGRDNKPDSNTRYECELMLNDWIMHPNDNVDICICPIGDWLHTIRQQGRDVYFIGIDESKIPSAEALDNLSCIEDIVIVGYPNLIWDEKNNIPIMRKGITATPLQIDYLGEPIFLIDAAIYPGSSGSPVFIINEGIFSTGGDAYIGSRLMFVGIVSRVYQHKVTGEIEIKDIPTSLKSVPTTSIPNNLGVVIKSSVLRDFEPILKKLVDRNEKRHHE